MMKKTLLLFLFTVSLRSFASEVTETHGNVRSVGMGGIWMSIVKDQDAVFVNPAALSKVEGLNWNVADVEVGINGYDLYKELNGIDLSTPASYNQLFGKDVWVRAGAKTAVAIPYFGVGAYTENNTNMQLHNPAFPQFQTHFISDDGLVLAGAFPVAPATYAGVAVKQIARWGGDKDIDLGVIAGGQLSNIAQQFQDKGRGYGVDLALQTTLPAPFSPTLSAVWQDVGSTSFVQTAGSEAPPGIHDNLGVGISTSMDLPGLDWVAGFECRHLTESQYQFGQKLHLGTEISLPIIDLRGGINQGYAAYGVGMNFLFMRFDVASYTEEMGAYPGQTPQNRIQVGLSIDLSFDADFHITDKDGKKRKLKQRR